MTPPLAIALAEGAFELRTAALSPGVLAVASACIADIVGVAVAGSKRPVARTAAGFATRSYGEGPATIFATGRRAHPRAAALANGVAAHALDYDDTSYAGMLHATAVVFPALVAAGEHQRLDGERFQRAFIAGVETTYALGKLLRMSAYDRGWFTTGVLGAIGAAAAVSTATAADVGEVKRAIALAASHAGGARVVLGTDAKAWGVGRAALMGYESALEGGEHIGVPDDVFEGTNGLFQLLTGEPWVPRQPDDDMGLVKPGIFFKRFPVCSSAQAALTALERLMQRTPFAAADVERIDVELAPLAYGCLPYTDPRDHVEAQFSAQFALACLLLYGTVDLAMIDAYPRSEPVLLETMSKIHTRRGLEDIDTARYPEAGRVTVMLNDNTRATELAEVANGHPQDPLSTAQLEEKFRTNLGDAAPDTVEALLDAIRRLLELEDVGELLAALRTS